MVPESCDVQWPQPSCDSEIWHDWPLQKLQPTMGKPLRDFIFSWVVALAMRFCSDAAKGTTHKPWNCSIFGVCCCFEGASRQVSETNALQIDCLLFDLLTQGKRVVCIHVIYSIYSYMVPCWFRPRAFYCFPWQQMHHIGLHEGCRPWRLRTNFLTRDQRCLNYEYTCKRLFKDNVAQIDM